MSIQNLKTAIEQCTGRPKGIKVSPDLWSELKTANLISWRRGYLEGVIDSGFDFPVFDNDIFLHVDPELLLNNAAFQLPPTENLTSSSSPT